MKSNSISIISNRRRISLSPELQIEGQSCDDVLAALLAKVNAPRR